MAEVAGNLDRQYRDSSKLAARIALHVKYGPRSVAASLSQSLRLPAGSRVLEVGCGPGRVWATATDYPANLEIFLTDASAGMVDEALARVRGLNRWSFVEGRVADVCALPFGEATFDAAIAMHMLYHARDPDLAVHELHRVLKPGGRLYATTNGQNSMRALSEITAQVFGSAPLEQAVAPFTLESGEPVLRRCFQQVEKTVRGDELRVTDPADVVAYLQSFPPGDEASGDQKAVLSRAVDEAFARNGDVFVLRRIAGSFLATKAA